MPDFPVPMSKFILSLGDSVAATKYPRKFCREQKKLFCRVMPDFPVPVSQQNILGNSVANDIIFCKREY